MNMNSAKSDPAQTAQPYLQVTDSNSRTTRVDLEPNISFLAGASKNCRLVLSGDDVHPIHCRFWLDANSCLNFQDWNTGQKTILNGHSVDVGVVREGDQLNIGDYCLALMAEEDCSVDNRAVEDHADAVDDVNCEFPTMVEQPEKDMHLESPIPADSHAWEGEESDWLTMEVEQLRVEVAERDAQIELLVELQNNPQDGQSDDSQTEKLVNRLEELLDELQSSDERVRGLEDLLQLSDEATQAEQEERMQLESWVTEIENRVAQREAEADAELIRLTERLKTSKEKKKQVEAQLEQALESHSNAFSDSSNDFIRKLRSQSKKLQQQLEAAEAENERLSLQDHDVNSAASDKKIQEIEQKLLQQQVEFSRERATLARKRAQLERLKDELEQKLNATQNLRDVDSRVIAMRQHLRDIHEQEEHEKNLQKQKSLGGRISSLLSRVSG